MKIIITVENGAVKVEIDDKPAEIKLNDKHKPTPPGGILSPLIRAKADKLSLNGDNLVSNSRPPLVEPKMPPGGNADSRPINRSCEICGQPIIGSRLAKVCSKWQDYVYLQRMRPSSWRK